MMRYQEKQSAMLIDINMMNKLNSIIHFGKNIEACTYQRIILIFLHQSWQLLALDKQIWMVPVGRNPEFVGREDILLELNKRLVPKQDCVARAALCGLGGVG